MQEHRIKMIPFGNIRRFYPFVLAFLLVFIFLFFIQQRIDSILITLLIFLVFFITQDIPALILYVNQLKLSRGVEILINYTSRTLSVETRRSSFKFSFDEVYSIKGIYSIPKAERRAGFHAIAEFSFFAIELSNNKVIIISCLMVDDSVIDSDVLNINGIKPEIVKKFFPYVNYPKADILNLQ